MSGYIVFKHSAQHQTIKDKQQELVLCISKGRCPYCLAKKLQYREFITNRRFGFHCHGCGWQGSFSRQDLIEFSRRHF